MKKLLRLMTACAVLLLASFGANAAVTCTAIETPGYTTNYINNTTGGVQTSFTITCERTLATEMTGGLAYSVTASNGLQPLGINNRAKLTIGATDYMLRYDVYTPTAGCAGAQWKGGTTITGTVVWPAGVTGTATDTRTYWGCINTGQTAGGAGKYSDTITMTASYTDSGGVARTLTGTIPVSIFAPASCVVNTGPGNFVLTYNAFQASPLVSARSFTSTCTDGMPFTLSVTPSSGTLAGVAYSIDFTDPLTGNVITGANGKGASQSLNVRVTAPAGQAGTCAGAQCTANQNHTLTITY